MAAAILHPRSERTAEDICPMRHGFRNKLKRGRKKTVTWANDETIYEVRQFLVDDAPSLLGVAAQELLCCKQQSVVCEHNVRAHGDTRFEAKRARFTSVREPAEDSVDVPPGFGHSIANKQPHPELTLQSSMAITVPWHCPDKFNLDDSWLWAGGEESTEVAPQQQREIRVFEACYPCAASIPDSPAEPQEWCKDIDASLIPLIPLEEEEMDSEEVEPEKTIIESNCTVMPSPEHREIAHVPNLSGDILLSNAMAESEKYRQADLRMSKADPNIAAVAAAACMAVKAMGENHLVDETLLLEILKNPSMLKSLTWSNQVMKKKSQDQSGDTAGRVAREPVTSPPSSKSLTAYFNASPVSVLANWGEGVSNGSPYGTSVACGSTNMWQCANLNPTSTNLPAATSMPSHDPNNTIYTRGNVMQAGVETAQIGHKQIPDISKNISFNPSNRQGSSLAHVYGPKDVTRSLSSVTSQNGVSIDNRQSMQAVATPNPLFSMPSVQTLTTPSPSCGVLPSSLSNCESQRRILSRVDQPRCRLVKKADPKFLQAKKTALAVSAGRAKRFCMYFNSPRGCRNGGSCAFVHQSLDSELDAMAL